MSVVAPAARVLLKERAYCELKQLIQDASLEPGTFLSERQLAERLGMSKTPIKAALERLELEGFVSVSPQQGIVVRGLSVHEVSDQFEIRLALEPFIVRAIAGKVSDSQGRRLRDNLRRQKAAAKKRAESRLVELDTEFHLLLCECHGNGEFVRILTQLREKIHRVIGRVFQQNPQRLTESCDEHEAIVDAILSGDARLASRRMEEHLDVGRQSMLTPRGGTALQ